MAEKRVDRDQAFLSVAQVAERLNVSKMTIYRLVHAGQLPCVRIGHTYRVAEEAMTRYLEEGTIQASPQ
jgi:excisionase family DNA binding protein